MILKAKKKTLFLIGFLLTGALSMITGLRSGLLKDESILVKTAHADIPCGWCGCPWTTSECDVWYSSTGGACFPAGALVDTPSGAAEIQNLAIGDDVVGYDAATGEVVISKVKAVMKHAWEEVKDRSPLLIITHQYGVLKVTANHWIYRKNDRQGEYANFDRAGMLAVGDMLTMANGEESEITKIEDGPEYDFVYNIEVENVHTYFADNIRVHNDGSGGGGGGGGGGGCCK